MVDDYKKQRRMFAEICEGLSRANFLEKPVFIKHFGQFDYIDIDIEYERLFNLAKEKGLQTREEKIKSLKESGGIDIAALDADIETISEQIKDEKSLKDKQHLKSVAQRMQDKINSLTRDYNRLSEEKNRLLNDTCEHVAEQRLNYYYLKNSTFLDKGLTIPLWDDAEFDEVERDEIFKISEVYYDSVGKITEDEIKKLALSDLAMNYWRISGKSARDLFGGAVKSLTNLQMRICIHFQIFSAILENSKNIPDDARYDPDKLLSFYNIQNNSKDIIKKDADGSTMIGATKEDYEAAGLNESNSVFAHDIVKKATEGKTNADGSKKKVLDFHELQKLMHQ